MNAVKIRGYTLSHLFYFFMVYSFIGWCIETSYLSISKGMFVNRGFLFGPFLPVYGFGALIVLLLLNPLRKNLLYLFIGTVFSLSLLEYVTGYIFETFFNRRLWDYSSKPLNLNGKIWVGSSLAWGILGVFIITNLHPFIERLYGYIPSKIKSIVSYCLMIYLAFDITTSFAVFLGLENRIEMAFKPLKGSLTLFYRIEKAASALATGFGNILENIKSDVELFYNRLFRL